MSQTESKTASLNGQVKIDIPDPEVMAQAQRRRFTAAYKLEILAEAEQCREAGELGVLLRREGLYASHLSNWRRQREQGQLQGLQSQQRGRKANPQATELAQLRRENERLRQRLEQADLIIDVQKKLYQLLGLNNPTELDESK
jgi:transposase-like protein